MVLTDEVSDKGCLPGFQTATYSLCPQCVHMETEQGF